jgi:PAS domain S-box-containing protein
MRFIDFHIASYIISPLFLLLLVGGIVGIITFLFLIKFKNAPGVKFWLIWQIAASIWAFTYAFEYGATDIETKIMWSKFSYFGIVYCPVAFLLFSLAFSSRNKFLKRKYIVALFAFASLFILSPFTNGLHHLHWKSYSIDPVTNATNYVYGPFFWIMTFFAYFALLSGIINIVLLYFRMSRYYRRQITLLFIASLLPPIGNLMYIFQVNPISGFDWTPFTFLLTGILIAINILQNKMFELVPFARNKLIDIIPDAILVVDNMSRVADLNPAMMKIISSDGNELIGRKVDDVFPNREILINDIRKYDHFATQISREIDGATYFYDLTAITLFDYNKQQTGRLLVLKDITQRIEAEEKIKESNIRLKEEIREKEKLIADLDAFSHTVAHDLKNMLGSIVVASNLIKSDIDDIPKDDLLELTDMINQSATKTVHITSELLTLATVRQQEIRPVPVNMQKVVSDSIVRLKDMIQEKGAQISTPEIWPEVLGYESWIEEVWINYISNAVKYGGNPPVIEIGSEIIEGEKVKYWIKDNGKGLSEDEIALLFSKFTRLDTLKAEGHGLGLSIVKRIIEKLNGEVGIESTNIPGEGSTFYFILDSAKTN